MALIVKRVGEAAGLDPMNYAGHSLRAGHVTSAAAAGVAERAIMNQTGHKSLPTLRRYIRDDSLFRENAAAAVGLWEGAISGTDRSACDEHGDVVGESSVARFWVPRRAATRRRSPRP